MNHTARSETSFVLSHDEIGRLVSEKRHIAQEIMYLTFDLAVTLPLTSTLKTMTFIKIKISRSFEWCIARCNQSAGLEDKQGGQNLPPPSGARSGKDPSGARVNRQVVLKVFDRIDDSPAHLVTAVGFQSLDDSRVTWLQHRCCVGWQVCNFENRSVCVMNAACLSAKLSLE